MTRYRFVCWSDGNKNPKRSLTVTEDDSLTAIYEPVEAKPPWWLAFLWVPVLLITYLAARRKRG